MYSTEHLLSTGNLPIVLSYVNAGLPIIPLRTDGSKAPRVKWQNGPVDHCRLAHWFGANDSGIGILCGYGNLEVLDFDMPGLFVPWRAKVEEIWPGLVGTLPIVETPSGGQHVYYRCNDVQGSIGLAWDEAEQILIETRGKGAYVVAPGSPIETHKDRKPYRLVNGDLRAIPIITAEQRGTFFETARGFNRLVKPPKPERKPITTGAKEQAERERMMAELYGITPDLRPGDDYNERAEWEDILPPHGWTVRKYGLVIQWAKPDSDGREHHATTGYAGKDLFYCFSTSVPPFEARRAYTKFQVYTLLNFAGDFGSAARNLRADGYGS